MTAEKLDMIPECDVCENNSILIIQKTISETDPVSLLPESDSPKVVSGSSESKPGHVRRFSTGNIGIPYKSVKILSRYLATSTSSCHDNCKYGTRQDLEPNTPTSPMVGKRMEIGKTITLAERKAKLGISSIASPRSKTLKPDSPILTPSPRKRETVLLKQLPLPAKGGSPKPKPMLSKSSTLPVKAEEISSMNSPGGLSKRQHNKLGSIKETKTSALDENKKVSLSAIHTVKKVLTKPIVSLSPKRFDKRVSSMDSEKFKSPKGVSHSNVGIAESEQSGCEDVPEKTWHVIETSVMISPSSPYKDKRLKLKHGQVSSPLANKLLRRTHFGIRGSQSPDKKSSKSIRQGTSISSLASAKSEYHDTNNKRSAQVHLKNSPRKGTKDKGSPVKKLSFRNGKVLEVCSVISSPRRLKFKRKYSESRIAKVETVESNFQKTGIHVDDGEISVTKSECVKVVLKHQDIEEKKAVENLFNNMIEETANKLAETKKSKVKALVGAFETVISLQDSRPVSTVDA